MAWRIDPLTRIAAGPNGCCLWTGPVDTHGYGRHGKPVAHRVIYELIVGPIPDGLELDHLCRVPRCVNPHHLEPVTHAENVRRGMAGSVNGARLRAKTHCKRGHQFTSENTYVYPNGERECRTCARMRKNRGH